MKIVKIFILWFILFILSIFLINFYVLEASKDTIYSDIESLPAHKVWLVFWASVYKNGTPSPVLKDRLDGSYEAYTAWKIQKIIVSGDNSVEKYDEPTAMQQYLIQKWVLEKDIFLDYAGFDTFDSIYRANYIFWVSEMTLFTQELTGESFSLEWKHLLKLKLLILNQNFYENLYRYHDNLFEVRITSKEI